MAAIQSFYLEHLQINYWGLERLMHQSEALVDIKTLSENPKYIQRPNNEAPYFNRWNVVWITLTHPFYSILSIFSSGIALLAYCLYMPKAARIFTVLSKHMTRDWEQLCSQWAFKSPLLTPSFNLHQFDTWDLYQHGEMAYDSIEDNMVKPLTNQYTAFINGVQRAMDAFYQALEKTRTQQSWSSRIFNPGQTVSARERRMTTEGFLSKYESSLEEAISALRSKYSHYQLDQPISALYGALKETEQALRSISSIPLFSDRGSCRGASLWFIFLFLKTRHLFEDPTKHLMAVAKQFASGIPRQAALLHAFNDSEDLLKLRKVECPEATVSLYELDHNKREALKKIQSLPIGIYRVGTYHHSLVFVKNSEEEQYVWNPEFGLYPMQDQDMLQMILQHHYQPGDPDSIIYFHQYFAQESA